MSACVGKMDSGRCAVALFEIIHFGVWEQRLLWVDRAVEKCNSSHKTIKRGRVETYCAIIEESPFSILEFATLLN